MKDAPETASKLEENATAGEESDPSCPPLKKRKLVEEEEKKVPAPADSDTTPKNGNSANGGSNGKKMSEPMDTSNGSGGNLTQVLF